MADHNETIRDDDTRNALGAAPQQLEGKTIERVLEVEDSECDAFMIVCSDGTSFLVDIDIGWAEDEITRDPNKHEVCLFETTETDAGREFAKGNRG